MHFASHKFEILHKPEIDIPNEFILCTIHRQENTDYEIRLKSIMNALSSISKEMKIILPIHPRTQNRLLQFSIDKYDKRNIIVIKPVGYLEILYLITKCSFVITDSGGLQKEAFFLKKLCLTLRNETEWIELVKNKFNFIAGTEYDSIIKNFRLLINANPDFNINLYGEGTASRSIVEELLK